MCVQIIQGWDIYLFSVLMFFSYIPAKAQKR